ncbi:hypothetical protein [Sorangium sp. So ce388]|uniref:hypothetical protein n=1 Tax=Sorangium sp. So ce388 TaxID=3133309 RepID=UPI003F5C6289
MSIEFMVTLDNKDWDSITGGWRCDALQIPDAEVAAIYHGRRQADERDYTRKGTLILWTGDPPSTIAVRIRLASDLTKLAEVNRVEQQKLELEKDKLSSENRWKRNTMLAGVFATIVTALTTYTVSTRQLPAPCKQSLSSLRAAASSSLTNQTLDKLRDAVERHAAACAGD